MGPRQPRPRRSAAPTISAVVNPRRRAAVFHRSRRRCRPTLDSFPSRDKGLLCGGARSSQGVAGSGPTPPAAAGSGPSQRASPTELRGRARLNPRERRGTDPHHRLPRGRAGSRRLARVAARRRSAGKGRRRLGFGWVARRPRGGTSGPSWPFPFWGG
jgi:hypothetical protein